MRQSNKVGLNPFVARACQLLHLTLLLLLTAGYSLAQDLSGTTPLGAAPGAPAGSYPLSGFENVNLYNGSLSFHLPLVQFGGRGGTQVPLVLPIEQKFVVKRWLIEGNQVDFADPNWWNDLPQVPRYGLGSMFLRQSGEGLTEGCPTGDGFPYFTQTLSRLTCGIKLPMASGRRFHLSVRVPPRGFHAVRFLSPQTARRLLLSRTHPFVTGTSLVQAPLLSYRVICYYGMAPDIASTAVV
jgi:hypothetical protein